MEDFFSGLAFHPHVSGENGHRKRTPEWGKTPASRLRVDGRKRSFLNTIHGVLILCVFSRSRRPEQTADWNKRRVHKTNFELNARGV